MVADCCSNLAMEKICFFLLVLMLVILSSSSQAKLHHHSLHRRIKHHPNQHLIAHRRINHHQNQHLITHRRIKNHPNQHLITNHSPANSISTSINNSISVNLGLINNGSLLPLQHSKSISRYIVVDKRGHGHYTRIQAAIDSIPFYNSRWVYVQINTGLYREKVIIPYNKPYIIFQGAGRDASVISWSDSARWKGTADSATFSAFAPNFIARGIGFRNAATPPPPGAQGGQAVAALLAGDMMAFYQCGFYGFQDTLFDYQGRHYFKACYIEGSIDFIFGHAQSTYKACTLFVKAQAGYISGSITAHNRNNPRERSGFVFVGCSIVGTGQVFLGRAWGPYSRVLFLYTYMANIVLPQGWYNWGHPSRQRTVYYGQFKCGGPGANRAGRVRWSHELSAREALPFLQLSFIDGRSWLQQT